MHYVIIYSSNSHDNGCHVCTQKKTQSIITSTGDMYKITSTQHWQWIPCASPNQRTPLLPKAWPVPLTTLPMM